MMQVHARPRRMTLRRAAAWIVIAMVSVPTRGQEAMQGPATSTTRLAGQVELARLIDLASERLRLNIEYDESALKGTVNLRLGAGVSDAELWALVNQLLAVRGLTTVRSSGETISVVKAADAANLARIDESVDAENQTRAGFATVAVRIEHRPAKEVADALASVMSKGTGRTVALAESAILLVSDLQPRLEEAMRCIRMLDCEGVKVQVEQVAVRGMSASQMLAMAAQVAAKREAIGGRRPAGELLPAPAGDSVLIVAPENQLEEWRELIASLDIGPPVDARTYAPRTFPAADVARLIEESIKPGGTMQDPRWRAVVDELTGSILITATPDQHQRIVSLLQRLDRVPMGTRRPVRSFVVRNRPVAEVLAVLQDLIGAGVLDAGIPEGVAVQDVAGPVPTQDVQRSVLPPGATPVLPPSQPSQSPLAAGSSNEPTRAGDSARAGERRVTLTADETTSAIIAVGEAQLIGQLDALVRQLDVRQPQVMLEVLLVSLTDGQTLDLGVELEKIEFGTDVQVRLASLFGLSKSDGEGGRTVGDPTGFSAVVLDPGDFSVVVRALQTVNQGRSLSMPRLLVNNNQQAVFNSVREEPFVATNASSTVATTSFGGSVNAGTTVTLRPQIAEADHLVLEYSISLSSFVGESSDPALPPPRQQNQVQSTATIPDGYTVVVGGLEATTEGEAVSQIPLLGDIPGVGELFKNRSRSRSRSRFFVFLRADVMRRFDLTGLKYVSDRAASDAAIDNQWPILEPRVIR